MKYIDKMQLDLMIVVMLLLLMLMMFMMMIPIDVTLVGILADFSEVHTKNAY